MMINMIIELVVVARTGETRAGSRGGVACPICVARAVKMPPLFFRGAAVSHNIVRMEVGDSCTISLCTIHSAGAPTHTDDVTRLTEFLLFVASLVFVFDNNDDDCRHPSSGNATNARATTPHILSRRGRP